MTGAQPIRYGELVRLSPLIRRVTQHNPGLYAGPGTNTHLVGQQALYVLDPGEDRADGHLERLVEAIGSTPVLAVIPSHGHPDHWPLAAKLAQAVHAPIYFQTSHREMPVARTLVEGERLTGPGFELEVLHTPGHTWDHLSFLLPAERALFPGDVVMGWSTSIIAPPEGDLSAYLASLRRLAAIPNVETLYPAHGEAIDDPGRRIAELLAHREQRTRQILAALGAGPATIPALVTQIYVGVDPALHAGAALSVQAHLLALEAAGQVRQESRPDEPRWYLLPALPPE